jgi:hypothetical protein
MEWNNDEIRGFIMGLFVGGFVGASLIIVLIFGSFI